MLPKAVVEALDKLEKEEIKNIYHQEGFEMGKAKVREERYNEYMNNLPNLLRLLYGEVDTDWLKLLSYDRLAELFNLMSSGISYDVLKKNLADNVDTYADAPAEEATASVEIVGNGSIGLSISTQNNPFFVTLAEGAKKAAAELGADLSIADAGDDVTKQVSDIEDLMAKDISILIVNPVDSDAVAGAVKAAKAKNAIGTTNTLSYLEPIAIKVFKS